MGVKIKKRGTKWYVYVNYHGKRKNRCVDRRPFIVGVRGRWVGLPPDCGCMSPVPNCR